MQKALGQIACEAYRWTWESLSEHEQDRWEESAQTVASQVLAQLIARHLIANPCPPDLHDLAARVLDVPSLCHGFAESVATNKGEDL